MQIITLKETLEAKAAEATKIDPKKSSSWLSFTVKTGLALAGLGVVTHLAYQNFYSPSLPSHHPEDSFFYSFYKSQVTSCESTSFKALQTFFNVFESPSYYVGLNGNHPPGDLQAFVLDQNLEGFKCAYSSYLPNQVTQEVKDNLFGKTLEQMQQHKKDLGVSIRWLVENGANPNFTKKIEKTHLKNSAEESYTPLIAAYRAEDVDLFDFLLQKGASVDRRVYSYSEKTKKFDKRQPIIKAIAEDVASKQKVDDSTCQIYKRILDASIDAHEGSIHSFEGQEKGALQELLYRPISQGVCWKHFPVSRRDRPKAPKTKTTFDKINILWKAFRNLLREIFPDIPEEEQEDAFKILSLDKDELEKLSDSEAKKRIKKACTELKMSSHPDREGGEAELFMKVIASCNKLLNVKKDNRGKEQYD